MKKILDWIPSRLRYDKYANVWVARAGSILTQASNPKDAWAALRSAVKTLGKLKRNRT